MPVQVSTPVGRWKRGRMHQAATVNLVPPMENGEFLGLTTSDVCIFSFSYCVFDRNSRATGSLGVVEISSRVPMYPIQELECHVNALEEAIKMEVGSANPVGCRALNKVLGARIPTILLHQGRSFGNIPEHFGCAHARSHFFGYQGCLQIYQRFLA